MLSANRAGDVLTAARSWGRTLRSETGKGYAFVERGWYLTKRYWAWEIVWVTYNIVNALAVTFIAKTAQNAAHGRLTQGELDSLILYLTIGTAMWSYISAVFDSVTETVTIERWEGTIEYTFMAPVSRLTHLLGACIFALIHGLALMIAQLIVISMFFHLDLTKSNWLAAAAITALGSVSLIGLGEIAAILPLLFTERGAQMAYIIRAIMLLVSGVYYPVTVLPGWLQAVAVISPVTYMLDGLRASIQQGHGITTMWADIWPLALAGAVLVPLGLVIFEQAERYAKRTGALKRNG